MGDNQLLRQPAFHFGPPLVVLAAAGRDVASMPSASAHCTFCSEE
jgi:hypothetical protein